MSIFIILLLGTVATLAAGDNKPNSLLRKILKLLFAWKYELKTINTENVPKSGGILLVGNHQSFIDWVFVILSMDRSVKFVIGEQYYNIWILKPIFKWAGLVPISIKSSKRAIAKVSETLKAGEAIAIFPEGQLTRNGQMGQFKRGFEVIARTCECQILPFYIHGLWGSFFSYCNSYFRLSSKNGLKRKVYIGFGKPLSKDTRSGEVKAKIQQISTRVLHAVTDELDPVPYAWIKKAKSQSTKTSLINFDGKKYKNSKMIIAVMLFIDLMKKQDADNKRVAILLPSSSGSAIANLAALALGKTVVNLNYTSSPEIIRFCLEKSGVKTVYTSSVFLERLKQRGIDIDSAIKGYDTIILEEVSKSTERKTLLKMALKVIRTSSEKLIAENFATIRLDDEAAILFSSGSEGTPKGIVLTHRNLVSNIHQISILLAQRKNDCILNSLPPFHAFGFTVTMLFPLVDGIRQVCAPDPTDANAVGKLVGDYKCTVLFATSTFANIYTKSPKTTAAQFENLRYVVMGAEKLRAEVRMNFESKFGKKTYEGYGATECTPVISVNLPDFINKNDGVVQMSNLYGSVGQSVPGTACIAVDPDTEEELPLGEAGLLLVAGPQVMAGYLDMPEKTNEVITEKYGLRWYRTGDKGLIDEEGFIRIVDRYSRFAKIGGEMISLAMVEDHVMRILGEAEIELSAVALPDKNKGEMIALLVANLKKDLTEISQSISNSDLQSLYRPKRIVEVESIPKLGSGKTDFSATRRLAKEILGSED